MKDNDGFVYGADSPVRPITGAQVEPAVEPTADSAQPTPASASASAEGGKLAERGRTQSDASLNSVTSTGSAAQKNGEKPVPSKVVVVRNKFEACCVLCGGHIFMYL